MKALSVRLHPFRPARDDAAAIPMHAFARLGFEASSAALSRHLLPR